MSLSANEVEKLGSLKSDSPDVIKDVGLEDASYAPQTGMDYSQLYGSPYQVQQPGMEYYKSFEQPTIENTQIAEPVAATSLPDVAPNPGMGFFGLNQPTTPISEVDQNMYDAEGNLIEIDYVTGTEPGSGNTRDGQEDMFGDFTTYYKKVGEPSAYVPEITTGESLLGMAPAAVSPNLIPGLITDVIPTVNRRGGRPSRIGRNRK